MKYGCITPYSHANLTNIFGLCKNIVEPAVETGSADGDVEDGEASAYVLGTFGTAAQPLAADADLLGFDGCSYSRQATSSLGKRYELVLKTLLDFRPVVAQGLKLFAQRVVVDILCFCFGGPDCGEVGSGKESEGFCLCLFESGPCSKASINIEIGNVVGNKLFVEGC